MDALRKVYKPKRTTFAYKMGRIKTAKIKRTTDKLMELHTGEFKDEFGQNKQVIGKFAEIRSKKVRNTLAGYLTRLVKAKK